MSTLNPFAGEAPAQPAGPPTFVVFFLGHSTMLSQDAKHIVASVADQARSNPGTVVEVSGPSTHIAPGYNPRYAQPRIDAVEGELLADGIRQNRIAQGASLTDNLKADTTDAQRVELRLIRR